MINSAIIHKTRTC